MDLENIVSQSSGSINDNANILHFIGSSLVVHKEICQFLANLIITLSIVIIVHALPTLWQPLHYITNGKTSQRGQARFLQE